MCSVKGGAHSSEPIENYHPIQLPCFRIFYLTVLVLQSSTLQFWFTLTAFIHFVSNQLLFSVKKKKL